MTKVPINIEKQLQDLVFELEGDLGPKFLIIVCDDAAQRKALRNVLDHELAKSDIKIVHVPSGSLRDDLIRALPKHLPIEKLQAVSIWGIDRLHAGQQARLLTQLNFHRDWLAKLNVPIIIWVTDKLLQRLINTAPDLWSRRSTVYYLSKHSFDQLLAKLFAQARNTGHTWVPEPGLSDAFEKILSSEKELGTCLRDRTRFSLPNIDNLIRRLKAGVSQLIDECQKGRQIEIALWLWNLGHLDSVLQDMLDSLDIRQRGLFDSLYTDRNEVLLHLSERLTEILQEYRASLDECIKNKRRVSLVLRARAIAISEINDMAKALTYPVEMPLSSEMERFDAYFSGQLEQYQQEPQGNTFLSQAADDLESWLSGQATKYPPFFSREEAVLLKLLYSSQLGTAVIAERLGISTHKAIEKVRFLERKVRLYLGLPPRFTSSQRAGSRGRRTRS